MKSPRSISTGLAAVAAPASLPPKLIVFGDTRKEILKAIEPVEKALSQGAKPRLRDLSYTLSKLDEQVTGSGERVESSSYLRLAIVATSLDDLQQKLAQARDALVTSSIKSSGNSLQINDPRGIYFSEQPLERNVKVAFLFPGQGSQYINMLKKEGPQEWIFNTELPIKKSTE